MGLSELPKGASRVIKNPMQLLEGLKMLRDDVAEWKAESIPDQPSFLWKLVHLNPALYRGIVVAIVLILGAFGLVVTDNQVAAIVTVVTAIIALIQAMWTRSSVTANQKVVVLKPDPINEPTVVAPGAAVSTNAIAVLNAAACNSDTGKRVFDVTTLAPVVTK